MAHTSSIRSFICSGLAVGLLAVTGCGGGGSSPDAAVVDSTVGQEAAVPPPPYCTNKPALAGVTDLSGTWVMRLVGAQMVTAVGQLLYPKSVFYVLTTIEQTGTVAVFDGRYCDRVQINPPNATVPVIIPDAWAHTEKPVHRTGLFVVGSDGIPVLSLLPYTETAGMLASCTGALPTSVNDPCVIDEDGDGNPGITVVLSGQSIAGSIYSVQKQTTSASAILVAPNRLEGALTFDSQQSILASDPAGIAGLYAMASTITDPTACSSTFAMVKIADVAASGGVGDGGDWDGGVVDGASAVDGGAVSCAWVRANEVTLFPQ